MNYDSEHKIDIAPKSLWGGILLSGISIASYVSLKVGFLNLSIMDIGYYK